MTSAEKSGKFKLTDDQRKAVEWPGGELLVAAAAGSGKTAVLVERFAWLVTSGMADPENLPALTFTEKAAEQLRRRIRRRLEELGAGRDILRALDGAYISTIHGFCRRLLRENYQFASIDPSFLVIPEEEAGLLKRKALDEIFEDIFTGILDDDIHSKVRDLCNAHGGKEFEEGVKKQVLDFYGWLMKQVDPGKWLNGIDIADEADIIRTPGFKAYMGLLSAWVQRLNAEYQSLAPWASDVKKDGSPAKYAEDIRDILSRLDQLNSIDPLEHPQEFLDIAAGLTHPRMHGKYPEELRETSQTLKAECFEKFTKLLGPPYDEGMRELKAAYRDFNTLAGITRLFIERYERLKTRRWGLDFDDLQHKLRLVLREKPEVGEVYRGRFTHLLVDEFQDNNRLQEAILRNLCPPDGLFMVGDSKQAIYRFRGAEPLVFQETEMRLGGGEGLVRLEINFRSRPSVCSAVNNLFAPIFTGGPAEIDYSEGHALAAFREPATGGDSPVEFHIINQPAGVQDSETEDGEEPDDRETLEIEADWIAGRIRDLIESGDTRIPEGDADRPAGYGDIVILLRAMKGKAWAFSQSLKRLGIPHRQAGAGGFLEESEIRDIRSLLRVIDNPLQDIPFAAVMRSPFCGVTAGDLYQIRCLEPDSGTLYEAAAKLGSREKTPLELHEKLTSFLSNLDHWRNLEPRVSTAELIAEILAQTSYADYVLGLDGGRVQRANLERFMDIAANAVPTGEGGLRRFLGYLDDLEAGDQDLQPGDVPAVEGAVTVMSIHSAKGLEFPIVIVPILGKQFNDDDTRGEIIFDDEFGPSYKFTDMQQGYSRLTYNYIAARERMRARSRAEELRILYVACTRAREKLILSGTADLDKLMDKYADRPQGMNPDAHTPMAWFMPVLIGMDGFTTLVANSREQDGIVTSEITGVDAGGLSVSIIPSPAISKARVRSEIKDPVRELIATFKPISDTSPKPSGEFEPIFAEYQYNWATELEAKITAGRIEAASSFAPHDEPLDFTPVSWDDEIEPGPDDARRLGRILHSAFELLDFTRRNDPGWALDEARRIVAEIKLPDEWDADRLSDVFGKFLESAPGKAMRDANDILKERSFSLKLPLAEMCPGTEPRPHVKDWILLQGRFDLVIISGGHAWLVDYKSDSVPEHAIEARAEFYVPQMAAYSEALQRILNLEVYCSLLFIRHGLAFDMTAKVHGFDLYEKIVEKCHLKKRIQ